MDNNVDNMMIGKRIRDTRREQGRTLKDVAAELGMVASTIQRYETGFFDDIKLPVIQAIARCLNVNPSWLIFKSEVKEIADEPMSEVDRLRDELRQSPERQTLLKATKNLSAETIKKITELIKSFPEVN